MELLNAPSSVLFENSDFAHAAAEGTSVLSVIISPCFMHCLICELAHSCTELDQTFQLCRINFCFPFISTRLASAFARMTNQVQISLAEPSRHRWRLCALGAVLGVSEAKQHSLQSLGHLEHTALHGLSAHSAVIVREGKFREIRWEGKWRSVNVGCTSEDWRIQAFPVEEEILKY